ncbi:hypothetical protein HOP50_13g68040 [Chloropicon primus]|uniref:Uncharacterized protein n=1 Tax=Chloropicon primus TaxID=1764295 RepID=A0A5B8MU09_9CHLO|nr:hypothetical protein A3770_13p67860 [Chloropicon primus]UPR03475.1 hypothetical protein HOP50_13g68040 [Chloropicon primus]|mmetsp:Transcript_4884/g.14625  ORF Transcript_4884/g.14625 Transcript_4884/m.14625 type:complete len:282 (+) Transcript_4884:85-930(+)|eukprot:QDZ24268.1 hypothetical protein A3770_13p67860 [Chloropicon primus]
MAEPRPAYGDTLTDWELKAEDRPVIDEFWENQVPYSPRLVLEDSVPGEDDVVQVQAGVGHDMVVSCSAVVSALLKHASTSGGGLIGKVAFGDGGQAEDEIYFCSGGPVLVLCSKPLPRSEERVKRWFDLLLEHFKPKKLYLVEDVQESNLGFEISRQHQVAEEDLGGLTEVITEKKTPFLDEAEVSTREDLAEGLCAQVMAEVRPLLPEKVGYFPIGVVHTKSVVTQSCVDTAAKAFGPLLKQILGSGSWVDLAKLEQLAEETMREYFAANLNKHTSAMYC